MASEEINFVVGDAIVNGTGAGQPLGILNSPCLITVNKESGQTAATVNAQNIVYMWSRLWAPAGKTRSGSSTRMSSRQLHTMTVGTGSAATLAYLPPGGLSTKPYATLLGRPVLPVEWCPTLGTVGDVMLVDLQALRHHPQGHRRTGCRFICASITTNRPSASSSASTANPGGRPR